MAVQQSQLGSAGHWGGAGPGSCASSDTTCDGVDDDCDGVLDEDCDFGPAQCPAGYRVITGTRGDDLLIGTGGRDCILGYGGNDVILGLGGDDLLVGGPGDDQISGGSGNDKILGGSGDDEIEGGDGKDNIDGGDGNDEIDGDAGDDTIHGGACHDTIRGHSGSDRVFGDDGSDRILDGSGPSVDGGNGVDACDGVRCELPSSTRSCRRDSDCNHGKRCVVAVGLCVSPSDVAFKDTTCDGVDDDCDGKIDEDYVSIVTTCGGGACGSTGMTSCVNGHEQNTCSGPPTTGTTDATCDGIDDDCDGRMDEDFASQATTCGVGACARSGNTSCVGGTVKNSCTAGTPAPSDATCDGVDDNCNGTADEGYTSSGTSCGVGACARSGNTSCINGAVQSSCSPGTPAASDTTCDGIDDNCNGAVDEGYASMVTTCGVGACAAAGATLCVGGQVQNSCAPSAPAPSDATCDGIDDNCNGAVDEEYASVLTTCGVGACARSGGTSCINGSVQSTCMPGAPAPSDATCNGVDDNCDGAVDEGFVGIMTTCGVGACARSGGQICMGGSVQSTCAPGAPAPSDATCDGIDDNCNGAVDEGFVSIATTCGVGACSSTGSTSCVGGVPHNSCTPGTPAPSDATCNGIDDNCNGTNDEGYVSTATSCGVGVCVRSGSTSCVAGAVQDNCTPGAPLSADDATCDGLDDNCNGAKDEDYASVFMTCGVGACARSGSTTCVAGAVQNNCTPGNPGPSDANCNGIDENCNGTSDEGFHTCSGTTANTCVNGTVQGTQCLDTNQCNGSETCAAGVCVPGTPPVTDDGDPCTADSCDAVLGVRHTPVASGTSCSDGNVCNGAEQCLSGTGCVTAPSGAVAWWPADGNGKDIVGGLDGVPTSGLTFATGEVLQAFTFDGVDDKLDLSAHAAALALAGQATLEMWVRIPSDTCHTVFDLRQDATHAQTIQVGAGCPGAITDQLVKWTYINGTTSTAAFATRIRATLIDPARFHHLVWTFDGASTKLYIDDGAPRALTTTGTSQGAWGGFAPTLASFGGPSGGAVPPFVGLMDEVTLYDHALTQTEVASIFNAGTAGKCKPPVCTAGTNAPAGTSCGVNQTCNGAGVCGP